MRTLFIAVVTMVMLQVSGCGEDPQTAIIGSWSADSGTQDLHFEMDGSSRINDHKLNRVYKGRCEFESSDTMRCRYDRFSFDIVRKVSVSGDELVLTGKSGQEEYYRRMR